MILFGTTKILEFISSDYIIYNLSSYIETIQKIYLLPPSEIADSFLDEKSFDMQYANFILNDDFSFMELMKIIIPIYEGKDVLLLISESLEHITESLMKFISGRYGIISYLVYEKEDLEYLNESDFSLNGLYNLDIDKNRYSIIYTKMNMNNEGVLRYEGYNKYNR